MKYRIVKTKHAKMTQGLLRLLSMLPSYYFDPCATKDQCRNIMRCIWQEARETKFLRRNNWEPLDTAYNIEERGDGIFIESLAGKPYLEFTIEETND